MSAFVLDETQIALIRSNKRTAEPGRYLTEVQGAINAPTEAFGIAITDTEKDKTIVNQLQKSAAQLNVKLRIYSRPLATPPFVGFQYKELLGTETAPVK